MFGVQLARIPRGYASFPKSVRFIRMLPRPDEISDYKYKTMNGYERKQVSPVRKAIYVAGFPRSMSRQAITSFFKSNMRYLKFVRVLRDITCDAGSESTGIALVRFTRKSAASRCKEKFDDVAFVPGYKLTIRYSLYEILKDHKHLGGFQKTIYNPQRLKKLAAIKNPEEQPPSTTLHVSQLPLRYSADHVKELFSRFGDVVSVQKPEMNQTFAHVEYKHMKSAKKALKAMNGYRIHKDSIAVRYAYHRHERIEKLNPPKVHPTKLLSSSPVYRGLLATDGLTERDIIKRKRSQVGVAEKPDLGNIIALSSSMKLPGVGEYSPTGAVRASQVYSIDHDTLAPSDKKLMLKWGLEADLGGDDY